MTKHVWDRGPTQPEILFWLRRNAGTSNTNKPAQSGRWVRWDWIGLLSQILRSLRAFFPDRPRLVLKACGRRPNPVRVAGFGGTALERSQTASPTDSFGRVH